MEFRTRRVISTTKKKATLAYVGLVIAMSSLLVMYLPVPRVYITVVFVTGVLLILIGAFMAKGNISMVALSDDDLIVTPEKLVLNGEEYPMNEIKSLSFNINGYSGMQDPYSAYKLDGMDNHLRFQWKGKDDGTRFYLNSKEHVRILGELFKEFYERHIPFVESTGRTRTYLFRDLNEEELAEFKKKYGYNV